MVEERVVKITCTVHRALSKTVSDVLASLGIPEVYSMKGKYLSLKEKPGPLGLGVKTAVAEDQVDIFRFYVRPEHEAAAAGKLIEAADLGIPGRGSIYAEDVRVFRNKPSSSAFNIPAGLTERTIPGKNNFSVLCCIVQRGEGLPLARAVLEMGLCVPVISFGRGMGLRDKLGLLRITIPVDKELIFFTVPEQDAELTAEVLIGKARLSLPGKGFIYQYPVRGWVVNTRVLQGKRKHVASMEQVIAALDTLHGSTDWRRRSVQTRRRSSKGTEPDAGLINLSIISDEGLTGDFVRAAMDAGAGGATLVRLSFRGLDGSEAVRTSHARETCDLIVGREIEQRILERLSAQGLFDAGAYGVAEINPVDQALSYSGRM